MKPDGSYENRAEQIRTELLSTLIAALNSAAMMGGFEERGRALSLLRREKVPEGIIYLITEKAVAEVLGFQPPLPHPAGGSEMTKQPKPNPLPPHYSGDLSEEFWDRINHAEHGRRSHFRKR